MRSLRLLRPAAALVLALLAACEEDGTGVCPAVVVPSLEVTVLDDETGTDLTRTARGWWISDAYSDELFGSDIGGPLFAYGPPGRYSVIVQHEGYATWGRDDIRVLPGECGPRTVRLTVRLEATTIS